MPHDFLLFILQRHNRGWSTKLWNYYKDNTKTRLFVIRDNQRKYKKFTTMHSIYPTKLNFFSINHGPIYNTQLLNSLLLKND